MGEVSGNSKCQVTEIVCIVMLLENITFVLKNFKLQQQVVRSYPLDFQKFYVVMAKQFLSHFQKH